MSLLESGKERLRALEVPASSVGAPLPHVLANDHAFVFAYLCQETPPGFDGRSVRVVNGKSDDDLVAVVKVRFFRAIQFGSPNDEALGGHRLAAIGLRPYSAYELLHSTWIAALEQQNRVHPHHRAEHFRSCRHFVFTFHDSTLEFVADDFTTETIRGAVADLAFTAFRNL
jgi:hypothetical protein